jgi:hypothetical protein
MKARWMLLATLAAPVVGMMALAGTAWAVPDGIPRRWWVPYRRPLLRT